MDIDLKQIIPLLDDPDEVIENTINKILYDRGESVIEELYDLFSAEKENKKIKRAILEKIEFLNREFTLEALRDYAFADDPDLKFGIYLICKLFDARLTVINFNTSLFSMAKEIGREISEDLTPLKKVTIFNHIFYQKLKFKCCDTLMSNEKSAHLLNVLESRSGNPIAISTIYFLLARCIGLSVSPLCFPSGFIPVYVDNEGKIAFFIDIFKEGNVFSEEKLQQFFNAHGMEYNPSLFQIRKDKTLLVMYLESLIFLYGSKNNHDMMDLSTRALMIFGNERFLLNEGDE